MNRDAEQITKAPDGRPMEDQPAWRTDFPIDWPQDHYVERRDFMKFMVLTSLAFTAGQFWIAVKSWIDEREPSGDLVRLGSVPDLPIGTAHTFAYPTEHDPCILVRSDERTFLAYSQKCTHLSCAVVPDVEHGVIRCPCHEGVFDLASGRPLAGPPRRPLSLVRLQIRGDDIFAAGVEERT
ncbi:MAG TPA: ubiquinol-cytochrome c reductase iron-sulfur subunit [Vicinamibacterales bacterium]|jgi:nitrite reductase/ring-hydroxylating ferredoxin subunit|nr:ubiquinol-cytochrome c reductase iron-sulfur subunit [Vicinamibacterales bacterium]